MADGAVPRVEALSIEEKVGQLVLAGFDGTTPSDHIEALLERGLGGVVYFGRNVASPSQVAALSASLRSVAADHDQPPPVLAVDQEGGPVARFRWDTELPAQMALGATADPALARRAGRAVGTQLRTLGVDLNLAPVLDVNADPANPVIGVRSFGERPESVAELGAAVTAGLADAGGLACAKHFPGHGDTSRDSHETLPVVDHDRDRLERVELRPFRRAIRTGVPAVMTAHIAVPAVTGDRTPATLAPAVVTGLLREELGYEGIVLSDCLEMAAVADGPGSVEGALRAIEAGCDLLTVSHTPSVQRAILERLRTAVASGRLPEARLDRSVERVLELKRTLEPEPEPGAWTAAAGACRDAAREIARAAVTQLGETGPLPLTDGDTVALRAPAGDGDVAATLASRLAEHGIEADASKGELGAAPGSPEDPVVVCLREAPDGSTVSHIEGLLANGRPVVVLCCTSPYAASRLPAVPTLITYDATPASLDAGAAALAGDLEPTGRLPVTVDRDG